MWFIPPHSTRGEDISGRSAVSGSGLRWTSADVLIMRQKGWEMAMRDVATAFEKVDREDPSTIKVVLNVLEV